MNAVDRGPLMISGPDVLGVILRRNKERADIERRARMLVMAARAKKIHRARLGTGELVESNLPLR